jgi:hypothetical protein
MNRTDRNEHHGLPRSHGGSREDINLSTVEEERHSAFHRAFGHPRPDDLLRRLLLARASDRVAGLPPSLIHNALATLDPTQWQQLYTPGALQTFRRGIDPERLRTRHRVHHWSHLVSELAATEQLTIALANGPGHADAIQQPAHAAEGLFATTDPAEQLRLLLSETSLQPDELAWVKPLRREVRHDLLDLLRHAGESWHTASDRRVLVASLHAHASILQACVATDRPDLASLLEYQEWRQELAQRRRERRLGLTPGSQTGLEA